MHNRTCKKPGTALLLLASVACSAAAHAADDSFALGGVLGYGDNTRIYGLQAVWAPQKENEMLGPHDLGLRLTAQVARWVASISDTPHHSLTDTSVMAELRYWGPGWTPVRPFIEGGFGFHLLSHVHVAQNSLATSFTFGEQIAVGLTFGDRGRYEVAALIHHASNARIKQPNDGPTVASACASHCSSAARAMTRRPP